MPRLYFTRIPTPPHAVYICTQSVYLQEGPSCHASLAPSRPRQSMPLPTTENLLVLPWPVAPPEGTTPHHLFTGTPRPAQASTNNPPYVLERLSSWDIRRDVPRVCSTSSHATHPHARSTFHDIILHSPTCINPGATTASRHIFPRLLYRQPYSFLPYFAPSVGGARTLTYCVAPFLSFPRHFLHSVASPPLSHFPCSHSYKTRSSL